MAETKCLVPESHVGPRETYGQGPDNIGSVPGPFMPNFGAAAGALQTQPSALDASFAMLEDLGWTTATTQAEREIIEQKVRDAVGLKRSFSDAVAPAAAETSGDKVLSPSKQRRVVDRALLPHSGEPGTPVHPEPASEVAKTCPGDVLAAELAGHEPESIKAPDDALATKPAGDVPRSVEALAVADSEGNVSSDPTAAVAPTKFKIVHSVDNSPVTAGPKHKCAPEDGSGDAAAADDAAIESTHPRHGEPRKNNDFFVGLLKKAVDGMKANQSVTVDGLLVFRQDHEAPPSEDKLCEEIECSSLKMVKSGPFELYCDGAPTKVEVNELVHKLFDLELWNIVVVVKAGAVAP